MFLRTFISFYKRKTFVCLPSYFTSCSQHRFRYDQKKISRRHVLIKTPYLGLAVKIGTICKFKLWDQNKGEAQFGILNLSPLNGTIGKLELC
ncbi:MAG: hypothetical protein CFH06_01692 [Alphaproteobacteria bacterium MarineAlpha3_Bin5]|nr:MAG: hypothetical protein CFH06_01692 [Alphaproteobacteria bacterium MarineAlpha3_Bin5]